MSDINLAAILKRYRLNKSKVRDVLFSGNKHPDRAFNRVLKGKGALSAMQLIALAQLAETSLDEIVNTKP